MRANPDFNSQLQFLHRKYFTRLAWARLTLSLTKSNFFMGKVEVVGFVASALDYENGVTTTRPTQGNILQGRINLM
jgi:hypothetical protein